MTLELTYVCPPCAAGWTTRKPTATGVRCWRCAGPGVLRDVVGVVPLAAARAEVPAGP